ncbi:hypothetical protein NA57DRAFT_55805 [Rhizodiscina lignyota]|uniref:Uncharacterized protein n=1 Tax=Rhizodiscina lignyota TaxID=1504668 RepID=A0A9P4M6Z8_9PEZI|nr:hypothetical protein NA57DRAFT_55805 [Rhizodiscina lignyota]
MKRSHSYISGDEDYNDSTSTPKRQSVPPGDNWSNKDRHWSREERARLAHGRKMMEGIASAVLGMPLPDNRVFDRFEDYGAGPPESEQVRPDRTLAQRPKNRFSSVHYARTVHHITAKEYYLEIIEDSQSDVNWISRLAVQKGNFAIVNLPQSVGHLCFHGDRYETDEKVEITLFDMMDKSEEIEFLIAPERSPVEELLVGKQFVKAFGRHVHELFSAQLPEGEALIMMQEKKSEREKQEQAKKKTQAEIESAEIEKKRQQQLQGQSVSGSSSSAAKMTASK